MQNGAALLAFHAQQSCIDLEVWLSDDIRCHMIQLFCETIRNGRAAVEATILFEGGMARIALLLILELASNACLKI